jgi:hypothetical protein
MLFMTVLIQFLTGLPPEDGILTTSKFKSSPSSFTDSPGGNYVANANATMTLNQAISIPTGAMSVKLEFWTQWDIENNWDYGQVLVSTNSGALDTS